MRELERELPANTSPCNRLAIVGRGRLGYALSDQLHIAGLPIVGPLGRGELDLDRTGTFEAVLLCVPDGEIAAAAATIPPGPLVGHCSGASRLDVLAPHECYSIHPLMTVTGRRTAEFSGVGAAIAGTSPRAREYARSLADRLGLRAVEVNERDRALYHAAASMASNFLLTLEAAAEELAAGAGVSRAELAPLVRATVENWARDGAAKSLTGPIARGDEHTVAAHRAAVGERAPELLALYDVLTERTRALAGQEHQPA